MAVVIAELVAEITNNPTGRVYGRGSYPSEAARNLGVLSELNRADDGVKIAATPTALPRDVFLRLTAMSCFRIPALSDAVKRDGWRNVLSQIQSADYVSVPAADVQALLTLGVADGVITSGEKAAVNAAAGVGITRAGSRAEELWGTGAVVTLDDLARAGV